MTYSYNIQDNEKVPVLLNWLGKEGLQFMQVLNDENKEKCKASKGSFEVLSEKFKLHNKETILQINKRAK